MNRVLMRSPSGGTAEIPVSPSHEPLEAWLKRGWTVVDPEPAPEAGFAPVPFAPATIDGPPPLDARGQDDVAHGADAPNVTC